ncbi:hypothetical protein E2562_023094 [Oryza meyeriana var. granulata]|uniref:Uncharacterized protein n=1 Tax=Oryza meyeriana var. granulata TaxID=110450 RepID=A0A6G1EP34_9ORYZ|nr:hypothetical protein E2562_023094 [Oryza meyeriana var. granulata]
MEHDAHRRKCIAVIPNNVGGGYVRQRWKPSLSRAREARAPLRHRKPRLYLSAAGHPSPVRVGGNEERGLLDWRVRARRPLAWLGKGEEVCGAVGDGEEAGGVLVGES